MLGTVTIMNLTSCEVMGVLNKGIVDLPRELVEVQEEQDEFEYPRRKINKLQSATIRSRKIYEFKRYQTKPAAWPMSLAQSSANNQEKFKSGVLHGIHKINSLSTAQFASQARGMSKHKTAASSRINIMQSESQFDPKVS